MRVPYKWLQEYLNVDTSLEELCHLLTMGGLEVEEVEQWTAEDGGDSDEILMTVVTPNRGDLLSMVGIARHAAALLGSTFNPSQVSYPEIEQPVVDSERAELGPVTVEIEDKVGCPRYSALLMEGVAVKPSPDWLRCRLEAAGIRAINNVVDCTNYVCWELGQPMHAFDFKLLKDGHIIVRKAEAGEQLLMLDDTWQVFSPEDLVIADPMGAVALAGVMGGADTQIRDLTTTVLLESAHFDPTTIRRTSLHLGMSTEASYRFERHVDPNLTLPALARAAELIMQTAGGEIAQAALDAKARDFEAKTLSLRPERCNALLGTQIESKMIAEYLGRLGLRVQEGARLTVTVPTFRPDIEREVDLIEEVAIVHGYDKVPLTIPSHLTGSGRLTQEQKLHRRVGALLRTGGLNENISFSMMHPRDLDRLSWPQNTPEREPLLLANPSSQEQTAMRTTLLPGLLEACSRNARHRVADVALYEMGIVHFPTAEPGLPTEQQQVAGIMMGSPLTTQWNLPPEQAEVDFYYLKGLVEQVCQELGLTKFHFARADHSAFQADRCARLIFGEQPIGVLGEIAQRVQQAYDLPKPVYAFELNLDAIVEQATEHRQYQPVPRYPVVRRDVAVVAPDTDEFSAVRLSAEIRSAGGENLVSVEPFDWYTDTQRIGEGRRSVAFSLTFRHADRTLTDEEIEEAMEQIHGRLEQIGGQVRTE